MRNNSSSMYASNLSSNSSAAGSSTVSGSSWRGETFRSQDLSMGPPPPVYDGRRGVGVSVPGQGSTTSGAQTVGGVSEGSPQVFSGGKI